MQLLFLLIPGFLVLATFLILPMGYSLYISFFDWNIVDPGTSEFVGFGNYTEILSDAVFQKAALNTAIYALVTVPGQIALGLALAIALNGAFRGKGLYRTLFYLPVVTPWVVVALLFEYMFVGQGGLANYILVDLLRIASEPIRWLADPVLAFVPIHLLGIWKGVGWVGVIALAGLQVIPKDLYESAALDGVSTWQKFRFITLPLFRPTLVFLTVVLSIGAMNAYVSNQLITNGGDPQDQTHFILTYMYEKTFSGLEFGPGAAISYLLAMVVFMVSVVQLKLLRRESALGW
jgi:multiple sugar transport system permease protein